MPLILLSLPIIIIFDNLACLAIETNFEEPPISFSKISEHTIVSAWYPTRSIPKKIWF
jgi:hypothetical protein